jgi:hypothetical protein
MARRDWREAGGAAADAVAESPSPNAAAVACVPSTSKGGSGMWSAGTARKKMNGR